MSSNSGTSDFLPNTTVTTNVPTDVSTNVPTDVSTNVPTDVSTNPTVPQKDTTRETPSENDDKFLLNAMIIVVGVVVLIILIIIIVFIIRSRHRRRKNLRRYTERQQRAPTLSLEIIDRDDSPRETVNGVHNELYVQDYRLPVTVFDNQSYQGQTHIQTTETNPTQGNQLDSNSSGQQSQNVSNQGDTSSAPSDENADKSAPVYENTNVSKQKVANVSEQMEQKKTPTTTHERDEKKQKTCSDYETAFPMSVDQSKQVYENITTNDTAQTDIIPPAYVEITDDKHNVNNQLHTKKEKNSVGIGRTVNKDNFVSKAENPKPIVKQKPGNNKHDANNQLQAIKEKNSVGIGKTVNKDNFVSKAENPKPIVKPKTGNDKHNANNQSHSKKEKDNVGIGNRVNNDNFVLKAENTKPIVKPKPGKEERQGKQSENDNDEVHDYENSLTKVTTSTLQQAKLLKSVPPPCNAHPYVNIPDIDIVEDVSVSLVQRQSSEYENPENVFSLHEEKKTKSTLHEKMLKNAQIKSPHASSDEFECDESMSKMVKSKCNARNNSQSGIKYKQNESKDKSTGGTKPVYANINEKNKTDLKPPDCEIFDYENEDTVKELKSTLGMLGKRGFSTSSLESRKQESYLKTDMNKKKARTGSDISKESNEGYLPMDVLENEEDAYLKMDDLNDGVYMSMVTPEEGMCMRMESTSISSKRLEKNGRQPSSMRQKNLPRGYLTAPKPCGGTRSVGYVNFSDQPVKYVNFFRSRSSDDVYTNCANDYAKMRNSKS